MTDYIWTLLLPGEVDRPGERSGGAAWQRAEMGQQAQESHRTGKHTANMKSAHWQYSVIYRIIKTSTLSIWLTLCGWLFTVSMCVCCQTEQLQLKLIQEKDLNDQLESEKVSMERQVLCVNMVSKNGTFKYVNILHSRNKSKSSNVIVIANL